MVLVLVVALVGAGFAGGLIGSSAVTVGSVGIPRATLDREFAVLATHPAYDCYVDTALGVTVSASSTRINAPAAAAWANLQLVGTAVINDVTRTDHWRPTAVELTRAEKEYTNDLSTEVSAAESNGTSNGCATPAAQAVAQLPAWFRQTQVREQAASVIYVNDLKGNIQLTGAGLQSLYQQDPAAFAAYEKGYLHGVLPLTAAALHAFYDDVPATFDTVCIAWIAVEPEKQAKFTKALKGTATLSALTKKYGLASGHVCYSPSVTSYAQVLEFVSDQPLGRFVATPLEENAVGDIFYIAPTKLTVNGYSAVASSVLLAAQNYNDDLANVAKVALLRAERISVDPSLGRWSGSADSVVPPVAPAKGDTPHGGAGLSL